MKKESLVKYLNTTESVVFLFATVFVIFFLLWGTSTLLVFSLISYALAFSIMAVESALTITTIKDSVNNLKASQSEIEGESLSEIAVKEMKNEEEIKAAKRNIVWQAIKLAFSVIIAIFSFVVLILY